MRSAGCHRAPGAIPTAASVTSCGDGSTDTTGAGAGPRVRVEARRHRPAKRGCASSGDCPAPMSMCEMATCDQACAGRAMSAGTGRRRYSPAVQGSGVRRQGQRGSVVADDPPMNTDCATFMRGHGRGDVRAPGTNTGGTRRQTCDYASCRRIARAWTASVTRTYCGKCGMSFVMKGVATQCNGGRLHRESMRRRGKDRRGRVGQRRRQRLH
jgi:hypothetical protein